jgi:hypothetical protein
MLFDKRSNCVPAKPALVQPRQSERPIVLHSLADVHGSARACPSGGIANTQGVIAQELIFPSQE